MVTQTAAETDVDAIAELQMRITYLEDEIQHLNQVLEKQRVLLDQHRTQMDALQGLLASLLRSQGEPAPESLPPHY
jgi:uncharacterized coiled-coil protein SlyX